MYIFISKLRTGYDHGKCVLVRHKSVLCDFNERENGDADQRTVGRVEGRRGGRW